MIKSGATNLLQKEMTRKEFLGLGVFAVATLFGIGGILKEISSRAAGPNLSAEPETGTLTGSAALVTDTAASGGKGITFGVAPTPTPPPTQPPTSRDTLVYGTYKPSPTTVGPVAGIALTLHGTATTSTDYVVKANNEVVQNKEIWGRVSIGAFTGVTIKNCIIHGTLLRGVDTAHVIANGDNLNGATIIDCALVGRPVTVPASFNGVVNPDAGTVNKANEWCGGIRGGNYTILRCEITNTSDALGLTSQVGNVTAKGCWIHNGWFNEWTAAQKSPSGGPARYYPYAAGAVSDPGYTHVDGIQFHRGRNYTFVGNRIGGVRVRGDHNVVPTQKNTINTGDDMYNAALMIKQEVDNTTANKIENVLIDRNWLAGSGATINITLGNGNYFDTVTISNNKFLRSTWGTQSYVLRMHDAAGRAVGNFSNNVFEDDGTPIPIGNGGVGVA